MEESRKERPLERVSKRSRQYQQGALCCSIRKDLQLDFVSFHIVQYGTHLIMNSL